MKGIKYVAFGAMLGLCVACGGGSGSSGIGGSFSGVSGGHFFDEAVGGMNYECFDAEGNSVRVGITEADGFYQFKEGETVQFYFDMDGVEGYSSMGGDIAIGKRIGARATITPVDVSADTTVQTNIAQFLQTFDSDGDPNNGITIDEKVVEAIANFINKNKNKNKNENIISSKSDITSDLDKLLKYVKDHVSKDYKMVVPTQVGAKQHLDKTLATKPELRNKNTGKALNLPSRIAMTDCDKSQARIINPLPEDGTDFTTTKKQIWTDDGIDSLATINDILRMMSESNYKEHINKGPYKALVTPMSNSNEGVAASGSTNVEKLQEITLDIVRVDDNSPMTIKVWMVDKTMFSSMLIRGYFTVTEGVSSTKPYGSMTAYISGNKLDDNGFEEMTFKLDAKGYPVHDANGLDILIKAPPIFKFVMSIGSDSSNKVDIQTVEEFEDLDVLAGHEVKYKSLTKLHMISNSGLDSGQAYISARETDMGQNGVKTSFENAKEEVLYFAHNLNYVKVLSKDDSGNDKIEVFSKTKNFNVVYKAKVFTSNGDEVRLNSGFPILTQDGKNGYVGYYGVWMPEGSSLSNGAIVTQVGSDKKYQIIRKSGKLRKHTRSEMPMANLAGLELSYWSGKGELVLTWDPSLNANKGGFKSVGVRNPTNGEIDTNNPPPAPDFAVMYGDVWCDALQSSFNFSMYLYKHQALTNASIIYFYKEETVQSGDMVPSNFEFWGPVDGDWNNYNPSINGSIKYTYSDMMLTSGGKSVEATGDQCISIKPLTPVGSYNAGNFIDVNEAPVFYSWESGPYEWARFTAVKEDSNGDGIYDKYVAFEKPLSFKYKVEAGDDLNGDSNVGKVFRLDYDGYNLHVPGAFNEEADSWVPFVNLKDGVKLGGANGIDYIIKGTEQAKFMMPVQDASVASDLEIDTSIGAPTITYNQAVVDKVGPMPVAEVQVNKGRDVVAAVKATNGSVNNTVIYQWSTDEKEREDKKYGTIKIAVVNDGLSVLIDILDADGNVLQAGLEGLVSGRVIKFTGTNNVSNKLVEGELRFVDIDFDNNGVRDNKDFEDFYGNFNVISASGSDFTTLFSRPSNKYSIDGSLSKK